MPFSAVGPTSSSSTLLDPLNSSTNSPKSSYGTITTSHMSYTQIPSVLHDDAEEAPTSNGIEPDIEEIPHINQPDKNGYTPLDKYGRPALMGQSTLFACTANLANTILGAGMLGLPHAFANSGYILGVVLLIVSGCASAFGLHLLSAAARIATPKGTPSSFYAVAHAAVPRATMIIDAAVAIKCFGVATSYLIVVGDLMPPAAEQIFGSNVPSLILSRRFWIIIFAVAFCIPLSCLRTLNALRFTSSLSIGFVWYLVIMITVYATVPEVDECSGLSRELCKGETSLIQFNLGTLKVLSIFIFGFTCHQNIFAVYNEIKDNTQPRINRVVMISISLAMCVYCVIASMGYHAYGDKVESDIIKNLPADNIFVTISRILISMLVTFCYPLQTHPCRSSIMSIMASYHRSDPAPLLPSQQFRRATVITAIICIASFGVAMAVDSLGVMLSIVGATGSTTISYILPGLVYVRLAKHEGPKWKYYLALVQLCAGCIIIPSALVFIFL